ncbi:MAG: hypothetical protein JW969_18185 [Spirochaetales bacterium]|nr:hypothetical protein [Spirochaetales bacterium]
MYKKAMIVYFLILTVFLFSGVLLDRFPLDVEAKSLGKHKYIELHVPVTVETGEMMNNNISGFVRPAVKKETSTEKLERIDQIDSLNSMLVQNIKPDEIPAESISQFRNKMLLLIDKCTLYWGEAWNFRLTLPLKAAYSNISLNHPFFLLIADIAARNEVPVELLTGYPLGGKMVAGKMEEKVPVELGLFLQHNRMVKIIWMAIGMIELNTDDVVLLSRLLEDNPNLYFSVSESYLDGEKNISKDWLFIIKKYPDRCILNVSANLHKSGSNIALP